MDWKRLIKFRQDQIVGLDIGSSTVKLVQLHKNGAAYAVTAADMVTIADDVETAGAKEMNAIRAILDCLRYTAVQTPFAVCGVCGPEVAVRYFKFPPMAPEEIPNAVALEAAQVCPFSIDEDAIDYRLLPNGENAVSGVFVAATKKLIERKSRVVHDASLNCVLMDVDGLAILNCFTECEKIEKGQVTAILNVGSSYATLVIMNGNNLPFIRDIAYAGGDIIAQIAAERGLSPQIVGEILACGQGASHPRMDLSDNLAGACQKLITDVADTLRYYMAQEKTAAVEKILLCGGFALTKGFPELLTARLPAKVVLWNPFKKMTCNAGKRSEEMLDRNGPALVVAAGLAMRSI